MQNKKNIGSKCGFLLAIFLCLFSFLECQADEQFKKSNIMYCDELKNGMKMIFVKDNQSPAVMHMVVYNAGGLHDYHGRAGLAHFFEHLMFYSTEKHKAGDSTKYIDDIGATYNASTWNELTNYYQIANCTELRKLMEFESDRMKNLKLNDDEVEKERHVIKEERRMRVDNVIESKFFEEMMAVHYENRYYGVSLIGSMEDIESIKKVDLQDFYRRYYDPKNATLIVVGNIDIEETLKLAEEYYGVLPNDTLRSDFSRNLDPGNYQEKSNNKLFILESEKVHSPPSYVYVVSTPSLQKSLSEKEAAASYVLSELIQKYLYEKLVDSDAVAASVSVESSPFGFEGSPFLVNAVANDVDDVVPIDKAVKEALWDGKILDNLKTEDLEKIIGQTKAAYVYMLDKIESRALLYARFTAIGKKPDFADKFFDLVSSVTEEDLKAIFEKSLKGKNYTVGILKKPGVPGEKTIGIGS